MYVLAFKRLAFSRDWNSCDTLNFWTDFDWSMEYHFDLYKCVNLWIYDLLAFRDRWISGLWTWGLPALIVWINIMNPHGWKVKNSHWLSVESADWHPVNRLVIWSGKLSETMRHCQCRCLCILMAQRWRETVAGEFQKRTFTCDLKSAISSFCFWI